MLVVRGDCVHAPEYGQLECLEDALIVVGADGVIQAVEQAAGQDTAACLQRLGVSTTAEVITLQDGEFLAPGFIDMHVHAPQYQFTGTATDRPLMEWLEVYTFPAEGGLQDLAAARRCYSSLVARLLSLGTTTAVYYGTLHLAPTCLLADILHQAGQRAMVGKVSMDRNAPAGYVEGLEEGVRDARLLLEHVKGLGGDGRVMGSVVPRFIPTCTLPFLRGLAELAEETGAYVQSHISESCDEVAFSHALHPDHPHDTSVFLATGLLTSKAIMAHGTQLGEEELRQVAATGATIVHCPLSNFYFGDKLFRVGRARQLGVKVSLGTDVAGGYSPSMLSAIRNAVITGKALRCAAIAAGHAPGSAEAEGDLVNFKEAFWLATVGGATALGLQDRLGKLAPGQLFDAQRIDPASGGWEVFPRDTLADRVEKWVHLGDDRNTAHVWVAGRTVHSRTAAAAPAVGG